MTFRCDVIHNDSGNWTVHYSGTDVGPVEVSAGTREAAIDKIRGELRYRLELCPCTGEQYRDLEIEIVA